MRSFYYTYKRRISILHPIYYDLRRYGFVYLMRHNLEISSKKFKEFKNEVENYLSRK